MLTEAQQKQVDDALAELALMEADATADGHDVDTCYSDLVEAAAFDLRDPVVRAEFHRVNGVIDRLTGIDPMEDV